MSWYRIEDQKRIGRYDKLQRYYDNEFTTAEKQALRTDSVYYISPNIIKSIVEITPDFLFGEAPRISAKQQDLVDEIINSTNFCTLFYQAALTGSLKGDSVIKLYKHNNMIKAQLVQPENFFPTYNIMGEINSVVFATVVDTDENYNYLLKEEITDKEITRKLFKCDKKKNDIIGEVTDKTQKTKLMDSLPDKEVNQLNAIPVIHIPNLLAPISSFWGISDLYGCDELILAINKRISEIDYILTKHADPKLQVPEGILDKKQVIDTIQYTNGDIVAHVTVDGLDNQDFKVIEKAPNETEMKYVQPNLDMTAAFDELKFLTDRLLNATKTSPSLIYNNTDGGQAESAKALKMRMQDTERKLRQKKAFFNKAIKEFFSIAFRLMNATEEIVDVEFVDLLNDTDTNIDRAIKLYEKGLISHREALRVSYPNTDESIIEDMINEIELEKLEDKLQSNIDNDN